ncbi:uncharacterized protein BCR38DRAFT_487153 [Pseudomassariella vexata]|uniref:Uncharacterized protein n=1 Tax=Pseudomassariella vexata TaxID=1141098 RepID=A0A1Y2DQ37_9PEZI|nr:uncharacterized protein BCR38DRAFT_487153 [Pseudomassariella vexata]ORY61402.1 hypothetical protein BCR38DRAFT_487153 [Pseudomassariella vexata]
MLLDTYLPQYELSLFQRLLLIWLFIATGLVLALQASQSVADPRPRWTLLNKEQKPYWYTFYVFAAFMLLQVTYRPLLWNMEGMLGGYEVAILDGLWIGLLGLEAVMIVSVLVLGIVRTAKPAQKIKES